ncbi:hypothetical protein MKX01_010286 [Papaver californicum]|nr:hypothetical protein MKX01_010286 [Papaver californicum]
MSTPGVTGAVMWDTGVVLGKFLELSVDSSSLILQSKKVVEIGSACGLVGCIAALLGGQVFLTDLFDRLKLLKKNVEANVSTRDTCGSATVTELTWGHNPDPELIEPPPDYDVIYNEGAVTDLLVTLRQLYIVIEYFLEMAMEEFVIGRVHQTNWHPDYCSSRVMIVVLVKNHKHNASRLVMHSRKEKS